MINTWFEMIEMSDHHNRVWAADVNVGVILTRGCDGPLTFIPGVRLVDHNGNGKVRLERNDRQHEREIEQALAGIR